jgi:pimeloyl-ACP methyl ester carboxylesterase
MRAMVGRVFAHPERVGEYAINLAAKDFLRVYSNPNARMAFLSSLRHLMTEPPEAFWASMRRVKQPALVVVGEGDRIVPSRLGVKLAQNLPHAELLLLPECGHVPQFEATDEILERLLSFLNGVPKTAKPRAH